MGIYDRDYNRQDTGGFYNKPQMRYCKPTITPVVKWIIMINIAVFLPCALIPKLNTFIYQWFSVFPATLGMTLQVWRLISYQFLHGGIFHIFFNMLVLFFFGPMLERMWGSKRFLIFYLVCGMMGGIVYPILVGLNVLGVGTLVGASGAIYGMLAAGAIMFPNMQIYVFGVFPLPFGVFAVLTVIISMLNFLEGNNAGGEAAHLAGMAAGAVYVLWGPSVQKIRGDINQGRWEKKIQQQKDFQAEVDRILAKVSQNGVNSLSGREKKILKKASEIEQRR